MMKVKYIDSFASMNYRKACKKRLKKMSFYLVGSLIITILYWHGYFFFNETVSVVMLLIFIPYMCFSISMIHFDIRVNTVVPKDILIKVITHIDDPKFLETIRFLQNQNGKVYIGDLILIKCKIDKNLENSLGYDFTKENINVINKFKDDSESLGYFIKCS